MAHGSASRRPGPIHTGGTAMPNKSMKQKFANDELALA